MRGGAALVVAALLAALASCPAGAEDDPLAVARARFGAARFSECARALSAAPPAAPEGQALLGMCLMPLGDYEGAVSAFEKAASGAPGNSSYSMWLGRALGRRAEVVGGLSAARLAVSARKAFERALERDPKNLDALEDLIDYSLAAPGFLGGGYEKAERLSARLEPLSPARWHRALADLAHSRGDAGEEERELREAARLAPENAGHLVALGRFLMKAGRPDEADGAFRRAATLSRNAPRVNFEWAKASMKAGRNTAQARAFLSIYAPGAPDDPPTAEAQKLLGS